MKCITEKQAVIQFSLLDEVEAEGDILVRNPNDIHFLFCSDPLHPGKVDKSYEEEFEEAEKHFTCALFSYESLEMGKLILRGEEITGLTIYRGWMMKPELYRLFYEKLLEKGIVLINTPEEYERYHLLPGWYHDFKDVTAESVWEEQGTVQSALALTDGLAGAYIVKDYVKSRKHEWYDACFIRDISDRENAERVITNFIERQGDNLVGGVVLRKYESLKSIGVHEKSGMPLAEEYRVFVFAGRILIIDGYWKADQKVNLTDEETGWIENVAKRVKSNFVTIDLARRDDGRLMIMELGDGQVSGLQQIQPHNFYQFFSRAFENSVVFSEEPMPDMTVQQMEQIIASIRSVNELVDIYAFVHNKFWFIEDDIYDYEEGTKEYESKCAEIDAWRSLMSDLGNRVMHAAVEEGLLVEQTGCGTVKQLGMFMDKYGYCDGNGWWLKEDQIESHRSTER